MAEPKLSTQSILDARYVKRALGIKNVDQLESKNELLPVVEVGPFLAHGDRVAITQNNVVAAGVNEITQFVVPDGEAWFILGSSVSFNLDSALLRSQVQYVHVATGTPVPASWCTQGSVASDALSLSGLFYVGGMQTPPVVLVPGDSLIFKCRNGAGTAQNIGKSLWYRRLQL